MDLISATNSANLLLSDRGDKTQSTVPSRRKNDYFALHMRMEAAEKKDILGPLKSLIIESPLKQYTPEKIRLRNETSMKIDRGPRERYRKDCGWASNPLEPYKDLGRLELDVETLLRDAMKLNPAQKSKSDEEEEEEVDEASKVEVHSLGPANGLTTREISQKQSDGFDLLKARIAKSKANLATVKVYICLTFCRVEPCSWMFLGLKIKPKNENSGKGT
jgi:hypothetical protein